MIGKRGSINSSVIKERKIERNDLEEDSSEGQLRVKERNKIIQLIKLMGNSQGKGKEKKQESKELSDKINVK